MKIAIVYYVTLLSFCQINKKLSIPKGNLNKSTGALVHLMNQLNNFTDDQKENEFNLPNCKYRDRLFQKCYQRF